MVKDQDKEAKAAYESLLFRKTSEIFNSISMFCAFLVICAVIYLRKKHKKESNRVSLRLQSYVSAVDMFFAAFQIMTVNSDPPGNWVCHVSPWGFVFTALLGCFFSVTIAFNLQIIFVHNYLSTRHFEKFYIIIPIILAFTLSIVPVIFDALGFDPVEVSCWYKHGNTTGAFIWQWATLHAWIILSVIYCTYAVITIINRLHQATKFMKDMNRSLPNTNNSHNNFIKNHNYKRQLMINQAVKRIVIYPIVPIITFLFNITSNLIFFSMGHNVFTFQMLANVGTSSQGIFNAIAFCFDPAMKKIWKEMFGKFKIFSNNNNNNSDSKKIMINIINDDDNNDNCEKKINHNNDIQSGIAINTIITSFTTETYVGDNDNNNNNNNNNNNDAHIKVDSNDSNDSNSSNDSNGSNDPNDLNDSNDSNDPNDTDENIIRLSRDEEYILALL